MSTSKPTILPLVVVYSIGGNVGSVQYLNVAGRWRLAPAEPAAARATSRAGRRARWQCFAHVSPPLRTRRLEPIPIRRRRPATAQLSDRLRVDRVLDRRLAVEHVGAGGFERRARGAAELDRDHRVVRAVRDRDRRERRLEVGLPALDRRDEAAEREQRLRARPALPEPERVAHHRALREAAEHDAVGGERQRVEPTRSARRSPARTSPDRDSRRAARGTSARRPAAATAARAACSRAAGARDRARRAAGRDRARRRRGRGAGRARPPARRSPAARAQRSAQATGSSSRAGSAAA